MNYEYLKLHEPSALCKRRFAASESLEDIVVKPNLLRDAARFAPNKMVRMVAQGLLNFESGSQAKIDRNALNWVMSYGRAALVRKLLTLMEASEGGHPTYELLKKSNPDEFLTMEHITPDFQMVTKKSEVNNVLVCFAGNSLRINIPVQIFHLAVKDHFDQIIYLRDPLKQYFTLGMNSIADDFDDLAKLLCEKLPAKSHLTVLGTSSGGFAAMNFANYAQPERLLLFSPPYEFRGNCAPTDKLQMSRNNIRIFFAENSKFDVDLVKQWKASPLTACVELVDGDSHSTLEYLWETEGFYKIIDWCK